MTDLTYFDSAEGETITHDRVLLLFRQHGVPESEWLDFFDTYGSNSEYDGQTVLGWLGY